MTFEKLYTVLSEPYSQENCVNISANKTYSLKLSRKELISLLTEQDESVDVTISDHGTVKDADDVVQIVAEDMNYDDNDLMDFAYSDNIPLEKPVKCYTRTKNRGFVSYFL